MSAGQKREGTSRSRVRNFERSEFRAEGSKGGEKQTGHAMSVGRLVIYFVQA